MLSTIPYVLLFIVAIVAYQIGRWKEYRAWDRDLRRKHRAVIEPIYVLPSPRPELHQQQDVTGEKLKPNCRIPSYWLPHGMKRLDEATSE